MRVRRGVFFGALMLALLSAWVVPASAQVLNNSEIPGSVLVFPKFISGTVNVGTATLQVAAPRSSFEISVTCPNDLPRCSVNTRIKLLAHWVCGGAQVEPFKYICLEENFTLDTTVKGTVWFNPENVPFATSPLAQSVVGPTASNPQPHVPFPPCLPDPVDGLIKGYLIVWVVSPDDINNPRAISFNGLIGNAVIRESNNSAGAYNAIPIQSVQPTCAPGTGGPGQPACAQNILDSGADRNLIFDGVSEYARVPGKVVATIRLDRDFVAGTTTVPPTFRIDSFITLLTLDVNSNRSNLPTFVDLDFFNEIENVRSTFTEFVCWTEKSLSRPDYTRQAFTGTLSGPIFPCGPSSCVNRDLRETRFPGKKVLLESGQAEKAQFIGVNDPDCLVGTCPVTLIGLVETKERGNGSNNAAYVREYSYAMFNNGPGISTIFRPN